MSDSLVTALCVNTPYVSESMRAPTAGAMQIHGTSLLSLSSKLDLRLPAGPGLGALGTQQTEEPPAPIGRSAGPHQHQLDSLMSTHVAAALLHLPSMCTTWHHCKGCWQRAPAQPSPPQSETGARGLMGCARCTSLLPSHWKAAGPPEGP